MSMFNISSFNLFISHQFQLLYKVFSLNKFRESNFSERIKTENSKRDSCSVVNGIFSPTIFFDGL